MLDRVVIVALVLAAGVVPVRADEDDEDADDFRERLTEREDKRRPLEPFHVDLVGRPLTLGGEYEIAIGFERKRVIGESTDQRDRLLFEQGIEAEAYYSFGKPLTLFGQVRLAMDEDLLPDTPDEVSDQYVERGESWLHSEPIPGLPLEIEVGRLSFEDDRRWWWDEDLDALRASYDGERWSVELAVARELGPSRSDRDFVVPEDDRVLRLLGEASFDYRPSHVAELFVVHQDDHSRRERVGDVVEADRADDSDARLTWLGVRLLGTFDVGARGVLGYWLDAAGVLGSEHFASFEDAGSHDEVVTERGRRDVAGWGLDAGLAWFLPGRHEPRLFAGYARGSGDTTPDSGSDRSFRQTELHANEAGYGGVQRYSHYGVLLDPELSNLELLTLGAGVSLLRSSTLDLVYHRYRMLDPAESLRDAAIDATLDGVHHEIGDEVDLVLALEEWERFEVEFLASAFRAGDAFASDAGTWSYGAFLALRYAF